MVGKYPDDLLVKRLKAGEEHVGMVTYNKRTNRNVGRCSCGWWAVPLKGPDCEAMIRSKLQLHLSLHRVKEDA